MKTLLLTLITLISTSALATEPTFKCLEQTGFKFNFYLNSTLKIEMLDENDELIRNIDGLQIDYMSIETYPSIDVYSIRYPDNGNEIAHIEFLSGSTQGEGEMIDNDNTMTCERNK